MITPAFASTMARYSRWQNRSLAVAANTLSDAERWQDRGAFFRSIAETLNHVLWDDRLWLARLGGDEAKASRIGTRHPYTDAPRAWDDYVAERTLLDDEIVAWATGLTEQELAREVAWKRGDTPMCAPVSFHVVHLFNHQTHHRGQVHAMLTGAGAMPDETDLEALPNPERQATR